MLSKSAQDPAESYGASSEQLEQDTTPVCSAWRGAVDCELVHALGWEGVSADAMARVEGIPLSENLLPSGNFI